MLPFTNGTVDFASLPNYQETTLTKPNSKYWNVILLNIGLTFLVFLIAATTILILNPSLKKYTLFVIAAILFLAFLTLFIYRTSFKRRGYALREKDILFKSGILAEKTTIIPLNRIQHIAINEGPFSRIYNLAALQIYTASGNTGEIKITGIKTDLAKAIKEEIINQVMVKTNQQA